MPFKDLREFISRLEKEGEVIEFGEEVDWNLEAGAILRRSNELGLPAPFFKKIKGYPKDYRLIGGIMATHRRIAVAMDMAPNTHLRELIEEYISRKQRPIKPVLVKNGPCKENIHIGEDVDLLEFPVPFIHEGDGGRFIGTWHIDITKDPDSDWVNWGMYRHMLHDNNTIGINSSARQHLGMMYTQKYEVRNEPMEIAIALGVDPLATFCAGSGIPYGVSEVDIVGGLRRQSVEIVKCETVNLAVPANAEIVIEGEIRPYERMDEGPFGEYTGYMATLKAPWPVVHVKAITHRTDPILTMSCMGIPVDDNAAIWSVTKSAEFLEELRGRGYPVTGLCVPAEAAGILPIVAVKPPYANVASNIAYAIYSSKAGANIAYIIVVEDDVDPFNLPQVVHALVTKCHPLRGIVKLEHTAGSPYNPWANEHERRYRIGARTYFDCTWPVDWEKSTIPRKSSFITSYPLEIQQSALAKWQKYGF